MKARALIATAALAGALGLLPAALPTPVAAATRCSIGDSGLSFNQAGEAARFRALSARRGMNCASSRYVLNRWLRRKFERSYAHRLPTVFYDGYVTWHCGRMTRLRWQCDEHDSGTQFRFTAYLL